MKNDAIERLSIGNLIGIFKRKGYKIIGDGKPYHLNIVGIRSNTRPNQFDDLLVVFWKDEFQEWKMLVMACTLEAGHHYLKSPMNKRGTFIIGDGQHIGVWAKGKHQGKYDALVQVGNLKGYFDTNKDTVLDFTTSAEIGLSGVNLHRAKENGQSINVDNWSAACVVVAGSWDYDNLMRVVNKSLEYRGNLFSLTVINERDL